MNIIGDVKLHENDDITEKYSNNCLILEIKAVEEYTLPTINGSGTASITLIKNYLTEDEATILYKTLEQGLDWKQKSSFNQNGEEYNEPRLTYWFGRPYKYSAVSWEENKEWHPLLEKLREKLNSDYGNIIDSDRKLNSVMCNYYRDNRDSIGWHADDETSLGRNPTIASISLGCSRIFEVCKRQEYFTRCGKSATDPSTFPGCTKMFRFHLGNGSLLLMKGSVQDDWLHRVPRDFRKMDGRINLTFRYIVGDKEEKEFIQYKKEQSRKRKNPCVKLASKDNVKKMSNTNTGKRDTGQINMDVEVFSVENDDAHIKMMEDGNSQTEENKSSDPIKHKGDRDKKKDKHIKTKKNKKKKKASKDEILDTARQRCSKDDKEGVQDVGE